MTSYIFAIGPFLKSPTGRVVLLFLAIFLLTFFVKETKERRAHRSGATSSSFQASPSEGTDFSKKPITVPNPNFRRFRPLSPSSKKTVLPDVVHEKSTAARNVMLTHVEEASSLSQKKVADLEAGREPEAYGLPSGSLILCKLVNSVTSEQRGGPIIGIVQQDVRSGRETLIPAKSRIFGTVRNAGDGERNETDTSWIVRTPRNKEYRFTGSALGPRTVAFSPLTSRSGLYSGIPGYSHGDDTDTKRKAVTSTIVGALARSGRSGIDSLVQGRSGQGIARELLSDVTDRYAERQFEKLDRETQVIDSPAGQFFYVFVGPDSSQGRRGQVSSKSQQADLLQRRNELKGLVKQATQ